MRHDGGNGWEDVTTSIDTAADIICGVVTFLSPFAVVEQLVVDADNDGVLDPEDQCSGTEPGEIVNKAGCSIVDLVPCENHWKNHGAYVSAFTATAGTFAVEGLISPSTKGRLIAQAARSSCGR